MFKIYYDFLASLDVSQTYMVGKKIIESRRTINHVGVCDVPRGSNPKTLVALKTSLVKWKKKYYTSPVDLSSAGLE